MLQATTNAKDNPWHAAYVASKGETGKPPPDSFQSISQDSEYPYFTFEMSISEDTTLDIYKDNTTKTDDDRAKLTAPPSLVISKIKRIPEDLVRSLAESTTQ